eukprot:scaffold405_cov243-Pinguiococcus_pyrenoidosus.AAC.12
METAPQEPLCRLLCGQSSLHETVGTSVHWGVCHKSRLHCKGRALRTATSLAHADAAVWKLTCGVMRLLLLFACWVGASGVAPPTSTAPSAGRARRGSERRFRRPLLARMRGGAMDFEDEDPTEKLIEEVKAEVEAEAEAEWEAEERQEEAPEDPLLPDTFKETDPLDDLGETAPESPADERPVGELTVAEAVDAYMYKTPMRLLSSFFVFATLVNAVVELRGIRKKVASTGAFRRAILAGGIGFGAEVMRRAFQIVLDMDDEELNLPPWRRDLMDDIARKRDDIKVGLAPEMHPAIVPVGSLMPFALAQRLAKEPVTFAFAYSLILAVSSKSAVRRWGHLAEFVALRLCSSVALWLCGSVALRHAVTL